MLYARVGDVVRPPEASGERAVCVGCAAEVTGKCGAQVMWHWAHLSDHECDSWGSEPETEWHRKWKHDLTGGDVARQEVVIRTETAWHRADTRTLDGWIIEVQHSYINNAAAQERHDFYTQNTLGLAWLADGKERRWKLPGYMFVDVERRTLGVDGVVTTTRRVRLTRLGVTIEWDRDEFARRVALGGLAPILHEFKRACEEKEREREAQAREEARAIEAMALANANWLALKRAALWAPLPEMPLPGMPLPGMPLDAGQDARQAAWLAERQREERELKQRVAEQAEKREAQRREAEQREAEQREARRQLEVQRLAAEAAEREARAAVSMKVVGSTTPEFQALISLLNRARSSSRADDEAEVILAGGAGTGKTTMMREVIRVWGDADVTLLAPTGKAARRLTEVTGYHAATLHSTIYGHPTEDPDGNLMWTEPRRLGGKGQLVVIDESSMVGVELATDLRMSLEPGTTVLWVGDPHQLPPVNDGTGVDLRTPHVALTRVHRSGEGIMQLAYAILSARSAPELSQVIQNVGKYPGVYVLGPDNLRPQQWRAKTVQAGSDSMLITYQNKNRHTINYATRLELGYGEGDLFPNEPLVVMTTQKTLGLANGELIRYLGPPKKEDPDRPLHLGQIEVVAANGNPLPCYTDSAGFTGDTRSWREARREDLLAWRHRMGRRGELQNPKWLSQARAYEAGDLPRSTILGPAGEALHVNFGYALTCHKMQGSEAENIGIVWAGTDPRDNTYWSDWWWLKKDLETARSWWYTAVTRTKKNLLVWK